MTTVAIVGLGYVGLPLAVEFGKIFDTIGYDVSSTKIAQLRERVDTTGELCSGDFESATKLVFSDTPVVLRNADFIIVAVPTPVDAAHLPDLRPLAAASRTVGENMRAGVTVVYESTVYPGATEEVCIPILEESSGLVWKRDFHVGYSPERINPGDGNHRLNSIVKVVSGDDAATLESLAGLYGTVVEAGVYRASSIKVAEAAKVIENTQRDLNIALMNELPIIFHRLGIDTSEVLRAAGSKWNFLSFRPGLVGGHCIGVDPYYLTYKAEMVGYHPEVILAGRRINDGMGKFVAEQTIKALARRGAKIAGEKVIVLGLTFKENVPDLRNSKVIDVIHELQAYGVDVVIHDPIADAFDAQHEYGVHLADWDDLPRASAAIVAVAHSHYRSLGPDVVLSKLEPGGLFVDVKSLFEPALLKERGIETWRL